MKLGFGRYGVEECAFDALFSGHHGTRDAEVMRFADPATLGAFLSARARNSSLPSRGSTSKTETNTAIEKREEIYLPTTPA